MAEHPASDLRGLRRSPLADLAELMRAASVTGPRGVSLREIPFLNMVGLRLRPDSDAAATLTEVTGLPLPAGHGQVTGDTETAAILWQGPDEFLLVSPDETIEDIVLLAPRDEQSADALDATHAASSTLSTHPLTRRLSEAMVEHKERSQVVDLSANRTTLELAGPSARAVLEKGCPMDLHPRVFGVGSAVSTTLAQIQVLLWRTGEDTWRIMPRGSFAVHVARWLMDAMTEFASQEVA